MRSFFLLTLLALALASTVTADRISVLCSGGGTRAGVGCTLAVNWLRENDRALWGDVRHIKGVSGGAWGVASSVLSATSNKRMEDVIISMTRSKGATFGPHVSSFAKKTNNYYDMWKQEILQYFVEPFHSELAEDMTLGEFTQIAEAHPDFQKIHLEFLAAGVHSRKFESAPDGWCTYTTKRTELKCYRASEAGAFKCAKKTDVRDEKLVQALAIASSAASTNKRIVRWLGQRKFPAIDDSEVPDDFQFLVDAGHFNNLPFVPFSRLDNKVLVFEYTDSGKKGPLSNFKTFRNWAATAAPNRQLDEQVISIVKKAGKLSIQKMNIDDKHDADSIFFIFRTVDDGKRVFYFVYPVIGATLKHELMKPFSTMKHKTKAGVVRAYDSTLAHKFLDEYYTALHDNLPLLLPYVKRTANQLNTLWDRAASSGSIHALSSEEEDEYDGLEELDPSTGSLSPDELRDAVKTSSPRPSSSFDDSEEDEDNDASSGAATGLKGKVTGLFNKVFGRH